ncbi:hypothetical protein E4U58_005737 [Claviceps cyperi]|nr:hypothetical protein E4U58_005737 [Claviceps cyperi]
MYSQTSDSTNDISSADDGSLRNHRTCPRLIDDNEIEDPGEQPSSGDGVRNGLATPRAFPRFMQLPPELRHQIWHFYYPDLSAKARLLEFALEESEVPTTPSDHFSLKTDATLASQTKSLRAMLSTHRESRTIAVRIFPDELALDMGSRRAIVRFRKESDVVFLMAFMLDVNYVPFATQVQNLAVGCAEDIHYDRCLFGLVSMIKATYPNSKRLYSHWPVIVWPTDEFGEWCVAEYVHKYMVENYDRETDPEEYTRFRNNNLARSVLPRLCSLDELEEAGLQVRSMVNFESDDCNRRYHRMCDLDRHALSAKGL